MCLIRRAIRETRMGGRPRLYSSMYSPIERRAWLTCAIRHPRLDHDPAHRWFRAELRELCLAAYPPTPRRPPDGEAADHRRETC